MCRYGRRGDDDDGRVWDLEIEKVHSQFSLCLHWFVRSQSSLRGQRTCLAVSLSYPVTDAGSALDLVQEGGAEDAEVAAAYASNLGHSM